MKVISIIRAWMITENEVIVLNNACFQMILKWEMCLNQ